MPKRIVILDPNGVEVAHRNAAVSFGGWSVAIDLSMQDLQQALKRENSKLGTYTITVRETP